MKEICKICNNEVNNIGRHIKVHKINAKNYYDKYIKNVNDGICHLYDCNNHTNFKSIKNGYLKYCCQIHAQLAPETRDKIKKTTFKKYGTESFLKSKIFIKKSNQTKLLKYNDLKYNNREKCRHTLLNRSEQEKKEWREKVKNKWDTKTNTEKIKIINNRHNTCIDKYGEEYKKQFLKKYQETCLTKYGVKNISNVSYIAKKRGIKIKKTRMQNKELILEKTRKSNLKKYGVTHIMLNKKIKNKILKKARITRTKNGNALPEEQIPLFQKYKARVFYYTNKNKYKKFSKLEISKIGICGKEGALQVDHIFSIKDGFINNIPPKILGDESNLQLLSWRENDIKNTSSPITKEKLFEKYENK
jgi:hypothetical protein